jgi:hypothetical protein
VGSDLRLDDELFFFPGDELCGSLLVRTRKSVESDHRRCCPVLRMANAAKRAPAGAVDKKGAEVELDRVAAWL